MASFETHFDVFFQDPFARDSYSRLQLSKDAALQGFDGVDWRDLNQASHERHQDVLEDFYFYEVRHAQQGDASDSVHGLNISGEYTYGNVLTARGALLTLRYFRPVETMSKGFFGFGAGKIKISSVETVMEGCDIAFSRLCLQAFVQSDQAFLTESLRDNYRPD